jgi:hypothetical protein
MPTELPDRKKMQSDRMDVSTSALDVSHDLRAYRDGEAAPVMKGKGAQTGWPEFFPGSPRRAG